MIPRQSKAFVPQAMPCSMGEPALAIEASNSEVAVTGGIQIIGRLIEVRVGRNNQLTVAEMVVKEDDPWGQGL